MTRKDETTSLGNLQTHLRDLLDRIKETGRPLFVTTNGETEAVVLSAASFDELMEQAELAKSLATLDQSMDDIKAGRTRPAKAALRQIANELGVSLNR